MGDLKTVSVNNCYFFHLYYANMHLEDIKSLTMKADGVLEQMWIFGL